MAATIAQRETNIVVHAFGGLVAGVLSFLVLHHVIDNTHASEVVTMISTYGATAFVWLQGSIIHVIISRHDTGVLGDIERVTDTAISHLGLDVAPPAPVPVMTMPDTVAADAGDNTTGATVLPANLADWTGDQLEATAAAS